MDDSDQYIKTYFEREAALAAPWRARWELLLTGNRDRIWALNSELPAAVLATTHAALLTDLYPYLPQVYTARLQKSVNTGLTAGKRGDRLAYASLLNDWTESSISTLGLLNNVDMWWGGGGQRPDVPVEDPIRVTRLPWTLWANERREQQQHINRGLELVTRYLVVADDLNKHVGGLAEQLQIVDHYERGFPRWFELYERVLTNRI